MSTFLKSHQTIWLTSLWACKCTYTEVNVSLYLEIEALAQDSSIHLSLLFLLKKNYLLLSILTKHELEKRAFGFEMQYF